MRTKYVLVTREQESKKIYTTKEVADNMIAVGEAKSYIPVTLAQLKKIPSFEVKETDYFRNKAEHAFVDKYNGIKTTAKVICGGPRTEMLVKVEGIEHLCSIYSCNIKGAKTWYPETACVYYETGQVVDVELKAYLGSALFVCGLTPGILDTEHWDRIKDQSLAFRYNEAGEAVTGLFK